jgi:hypothetical protein
VAYIKVQPRNFSGWSEINHENLGRDSQSLSRDLNTGPLEFETEGLKHSVVKFRLHFI